jgi:hypothetical protein
MPLPLYSRGKTPLYLLDKKLGGPTASLGPVESNPGIPTLRPSLCGLTFSDSTFELLLLLYTLFPHSNLKGLFARD